MYRRQKHCRWCGNAYIALRLLDRDGFCKPAHKQAHYRAYKNYVTAVGRQISMPAAGRVTPKKARKRGDKRANTKTKKL